MLMTKTKTATTLSDIGFPMKFAKHPCSEGGLSCLSYRSKCSTFPTVPCRWTLSCLLWKDCLFASCSASLHPKHTRWREEMLDSNTAYTAAAAAALVSIVIIARISGWSSRPCICTNFKDISLDSKPHQAIFCLGVPELLTSNLVLFVVLMSFNDGHFHRICKPHRLHHTMVSSVKRGEFYNQTGHDEGEVLYGCVQMSLCTLGEHFWKCSRRNIFLLSIPFNSPRWVLLNGNIKRTIFHILQYEKCSPNVFLTIDVDSHYLKVAFWFECYSPLNTCYLYSHTGPPYLPPFSQETKNPKETATMVIFPYYGRL